MMKLYITPRYLNEAIKIATENLDSYNWISTLYIYYMFLVDTTYKLGKRFHGDLKEFKESRKLKQKYTYNYNFNKEKRNLKEIINNFKLEDKNEIDKEIDVMLLKLRKVKSKNQKLLNVLVKRVKKQQ